MNVFLELAKDGARVFYSARLGHPGLDEVQDRTKEEIGRFIRTRWDAGELASPYIVIVDFVVSRTQMIAYDGLTTAEAKSLSGWAATGGLSGLAVSEAFRGRVFPAEG